MLLGVVILLGASVWHATTFRGVSQDRALDSIDALSTFYGLYPDGEWDRIGTRIGEDLNGTGAILALRAVGAIPYYSRLETVDMWGLNDHEIAEHGIPVPAYYRRPGHRRHATLRQLEARGVNFVIDHPTLVRRDLVENPAATPVLQQFLAGILQYQPEPIAEAWIVFMPVDAQRGLLLWYLTPTPAIDGRIRGRGWEIRHLRADP